MVAKAQYKKPSWTDDALQGISFWIGHHRALYRHHTLPEGAIVAELASLISRHLYDTEKNRQYLYCEVRYKKIAARWTERSKERVDMLLSNDKVQEDAVSRHDFSRSANCAIEVKRATAPRKFIDEDLKCLAELRRKNRKLKAAYLVVVGEKRIPKRFGEIKKSKKTLRVFYKRGKQFSAQKGNQRRRPAFWYRVRRFCIASPSFRPNRNLHWACLIEAGPTK